MAETLICCSYSTTRPSTRFSGSSEQLRSFLCSKAFIGAICCGQVDFASLCLIDMY
jgi:hypothetical protein